MSTQNFPNSFHSFTIFKMKEMKQIVLILTGKENTSWIAPSIIKWVWQPSHPLIFATFSCNVATGFFCTQASFLAKHFVVKQKTWLERTITPQSMSPKLNTGNLQGENCMCYRDFSFPSTNMLINVYISKRTKQKGWLQQVNSWQETQSSKILLQSLHFNQPVPILQKERKKLHHKTNLSQMLLK